MQTTFFANAAGAVAEWMVAWMLAMRDKLRVRKNMRRAMVVVVCMASTLVLANFDGMSVEELQASVGASSVEIPQTPVVNSYPYVHTSEMLDRVGKAIDDAFAKVAGGGALKQMGNQILAFLLVAMMVWTSLRTMAGGKGFGELIGEWVPVFIAFGVAYLFVNDRVGDSIVSTMDAIGTAIGGQSMATIQASAAAVMEPIFKSFQQVWQMPRASESASWFKDILSGALTAQILAFLVTWALKAVTAFVLLMSGIIVLATVVMAHLSIKLALLLAPILVPFLLFRPMSWVFDGWLKFLLGACMLKIVVAFFLNIATALLGAMTSLGSLVYAEATGASALDTIQADALLHGVMLVFAVLTTLLMMSAPGIATGLLSGSAGSTGFGGIRGLTQSPAGRIASASVAGPAAAVGGKGAQLAKNAFASSAGKRHALAGQAKDMKYRNPEARNAYDRAYRNATTKKISDAPI